MKMIKAYLEKNRIICLVEGILLILLLVLALCIPRFSELHSGETLFFAYPQEELVQQLPDGSYVITSDNWNTEINAWGTGNLELHPGLYSLKVAYTSEGIIPQDNYVVVSDTSTMNQFAKPVFEDGKQELLYEFEVHGFTEELSVDIHYGGYGQMRVKSITVEENALGRFGTLIQILLLFLVINFVLWCIGKTNGKINYILMAAGVIFVSLPFFADYLIPGHDIQFHMSRIQLIADALREGQFPVRIYDGAFGGYGYASPIFYGEIFLYIPAILHLLGIPIYRAYQIYVCLVTIATMWIAYRCFYKMFRSETAGAFSAVLYTCSFWRLMNISIRAAVGEYTAMTFIPLVAYAIWGMISEQIADKKKLWIPLCLGMTGILQSHMISLFLVGMAAGIVLIIFCKKACKKANIVVLGKSIVGFGLINAWFLLPFLSMSGMDLHMNYMPVTFNREVLYPIQMFLGLSSFGGKDVVDGMTGEMPLSIGIAMSVVLLGSMYMLIRYRGQLQDEAAYKMARFSTIAALVILWMTSIYFPWSFIQKVVPFIYNIIVKIQYPWRMLGLATLLLAVSAGATLVLIHQVCRQHKTLYMGTVFICLLLSVGMALSTHANNADQWNACNLEERELYMDSLYLLQGTNVDELVKTPIASEGITVTNAHKERGVYQVFVDNAGLPDGIVILPLGYYPCYEAIDQEHGTPLSIEAEPNTKAILVHIPAGYTGVVQCNFVPLMLWRVSEVVAVLAFIGYVAFILIRRKKKFEEQVRADA